MKLEIVVVLIQAQFVTSIILPDIATAQATDTNEHSVTSFLCCGWLVPVIFLFESWQRPTATQIFTEGGVLICKDGKLNTEFALY